MALLFKRLAMLKTDAPVLRDVADLHWRGPTEAFAGWTERMGTPRMLERSRNAHARVRAAAEA
jgi:hypothetical protein